MFLEVNSPCQACSVNDVFRQVHSGRMIRSTSKHARQIDGPRRKNMSSFLDRITGRDKTQIPLYEDDGLESLEDGQWQSQDWVTYTGRNYGLAVLSSPFQLTETLLQVQYRGDPSLLNKATGNKAEAGSAATLAAQETPAAEVGP